MKPENLEDLYELSPLQQGMLFDHLYAPKSGVYFIQTHFTLKGKLQPAAFEQAWQHIVDRYAALRSSFHWRDIEKPLQLVQKNSDIKMARLDWSAVSQTDQSQHFNNFLMEDRAAGFDLSKTPLMRLTLIKLGEDVHQCLWSYHHLLIDGWSAAIILRDVFNTYKTLCMKQTPPVFRAGRYRDYITWLQSQDSSKAETFWRDYLAGLEAPSPLGVDKRAAVELDFSYAESVSYLTGGTTKSLAEFAKKHQLTQSAILLGVWSLLLHHYSGEDDVAFGTIVSGRPPELAGVESLVGLFINNQPVRVQIDSESSVQSWLQALNKKQLELRQFEHSSLVDVQSWSSIPTNQPLFESLFVFENYMTDNNALPELPDGLQISDFNVIERVNFPLSLFCQTPSNAGGEMTLRFLYDANRFESGALERMAGHFEKLLSGIINNADKNLDEIPLLADNEVQQLLVDFNDTARNFENGVCLHQLFEAQVARNAQATAVSFGEERLTYVELDARANQLAHRLRELGVGPETLVGVALHRSAEMVVGLLGILKAGGAYVPLDPAYPKERLAIMVEDSGLSVLLTQSDLVDSLPEHNAQAVLLDDDWETISNYPTTNVTTAVGTDNRAYVIYTSGSTGRPKGVEICHEAVVNFMHATAEKPGLTSEDILLAVTTLSFDISILEIFLPLSQGAHVVVASREIASDGRLLAQALSNCGATVMQATPATWRMLLEAGWEGDRTLKMLCGGEAMAAELADQLVVRGGSLWNMYGPTETTIWSSVLKIEPGSRVCVGPPIANTEFYILDKKRQPVPVGVAGELYIGGLGLARGYLNRPDLTEERFVRDPYSKRAGARLYRTGDLVRYLENGTIEFINRIDNQVKIRGFRIELGEIEEVLGAHAAVQAPVVVVREDRPGDKRLVAYFRPATDEVPDVATLRQFLQEKLPDYMIPSFLVELEEYPLTPSGKVDRKRLPIPELSQDIAAETYVAPRTETESAIAGIWCDVLGIEQAGVHHNFFELGGHSLLATQVISRIRTKLEIDLPLRLLFDRPTIAGLSEVAESAVLGESGEPSTAELPKRNADAVLEPSFAQQRMWILEQMDPGASTYNIPWNLRLKGPLNVEALKRGVQEIVKRHEILRTTFESKDGLPIQNIAESLALPLSLIDLSAVPKNELETEIAHHSMAFANKPFELGQGPLLRTGLLKINEEDYVFMLTTHHIISDGWSSAIFLRELSVLYSAFLKGENSPLPSLGVQYADYALWEKQQLPSERFQEQLEFWKKRLADNPPVLEFPTDFPRPVVQTSTPARQHLNLSASLSAELKNLSQSKGVSLFMTLLTAFKVLMFRHTRQEDIVIGSPVAGRQLKEVEDLIGPFINTLVLRSRITIDQSFRDALQGVKETCLAAYAHQDIPFEKLLEEIQPERDLSRTPVFQILFNMLSFHEDVLFSGLKTELFAVPDLGAKFDMTMYVIEVDEKIHFNLVYNADLFEASRMQELLQQLQHLLTQVVAEPSKLIRDISIVTPAAKKLLPDPTVIISETTYELVPEAIINLAKRHPDLQAISQQGKNWTYSELAGKAGQIALSLVADGVTKGEVVAIYGHSGFGLICSILGVLMSGGVLLTLDRKLPSERQALMLTEAKANRMLQVGDQDLHDWMRETLSVVRVNAETAELLETTAVVEESTQLPEVMPNDAAYVFFTSGTTGVPKGVLGCHKGLAHFLNWQRTTFSIETSDRCGQLTGLSFDVVLRAIFLPLTSGATLCLPEEGHDVATPQTLKWIDREEITRFHTVPTLANAWLLSRYPDVTLKTVRTIFFAGEPLTDSLIKKWREAFPQAGEIVNLYGPTETTLAKCFFRVPEDNEHGVQPIGTPIPETQALILSDNHELCGIGEAGEIVLRTPFRSLGYINAPDEMRKRFLMNPFRTDPEDLLYLTGDQGRYRTDGSLDILGRLDDQVKIRGMRIELDEISAVLSRHPSVKQATTMAYENEMGEKSLVAYMATDGGTNASISDLRSFMKEKLPYYMVPSAFVTMEALPMTPNGKVDRKQLPEPDSQPSINDDTEFVAPSTPNEQLIAEIWQEVLSEDQIGVYDNFFDLGGHSLIAMKAIFKLEKKIGVQLNPREMMLQNLGQLAAMCDERQAKAAEAGNKHFTHRLINKAKELFI